MAGGAAPPPPPGRLRRWILPVKPPEPVNPALDPYGLSKTAQADHQQNEQLLEPSKRALALTRELRGAGDEPA
jgi:hypothetical protein